MANFKKYLPWTVRIIIFILFALSALSKLFPLWAFEKQLVDLGIADWCSAPYWSRLIVAAELALAIAILQNHFLKRLVIPATILMLVGFCIHLSIQMVEHGPMSGNCGCFGQLIPMTPLEAFIKNILTIALLIYLYRKLEEKERGENRFIYPVAIFLGCVALSFLFFPFCPCESKAEIKQMPSSEQAMEVANSDTLTQSATPPVKQIVQDSAKPTEVVKQEIWQPKKVVSRFGAYSQFGTQKTDLNEGKKIVCLFAPGCDHCRETAREIAKLSKQKDFPEVYVLFMDEETELIPDFFKFAGRSYPYQIVDIPVFWQLFGADGQTPGVFYLWNGNIVQSFQGIEADHFDAKKLMKVLKKEKI